jgi:glutamate dehydrogenase (NAD(P)+)
MRAVHETVTHGVPAWLAVDRLRKGLAFGGFRFSEGVSRAQVELLASTMSGKLAAHGLVVGGAKAGVRCRPDHPRIDAILTDLAEAWREPLTQEVILGKDMGASDALLDRLYEHLGQPQLGIVQRRSPACPGRIRDLAGYVRDMTGLGAVIAAEAAVGSLAGRRILVQGAGVVGAGIAVRARERGALLVGMSDVDRAIVAAEGLPGADAVLQARAAGRPFTLALLETAGSDWIERNALLAREADILFLAAGSHVVPGALAQTIAAPLVVEASNFGLTAEANGVLAARGVTVVPDVIASSSSAAMTCLQLASGNGLHPAALWDRIESNIRAAVATSMACAREQGVPLREAHARIYADVLSG